MLEALMRAGPPSLDAQLEEAAEGTESDPAIPDQGTTVGKDCDQLEATRDAVSDQALDASSQQQQNHPASQSKRGKRGKKGKSATGTAADDGQML